MSVDSHGQELKGKVRKVTGLTLEFILMWSTVASSKLLVDEKLKLKPGATVIHMLLTMHKHILMH